MRSQASTREVLIGQHVLCRGPIDFTGTELFVPFTVTGPEASEDIAQDHVIVFRPGDPSKLTWTEAVGGNHPDGRVFVVMRFPWPGGTQVRIRYVDLDHTPLEEEDVNLDQPNPQADGLSALPEGTALLLSSDWPGSAIR